MLRRRGRRGRRWRVTARLTGGAGGDTSSSAPLTSNLKHQRQTERGRGGKSERESKRQYDREREEERCTFPQYVLVSYSGELGKSGIWNVTQEVRSVTFLAEKKIRKQGGSGKSAVPPMATWGWLQFWVSLKTKPVSPLHKTLYVLLNGWPLLSWCLMENFKWIMTEWSKRSKKSGLEFWCVMFQYLTAMHWHSL